MFVDFHTREFLFAYFVYYKLPPRDCGGQERGVPIACLHKSLDPHAPLLEAPQAAIAIATATCLAQVGGICQCCRRAGRNRTAQLSQTIITLTSAPGPFQLP